MRYSSPSIMRTWASGADYNPFLLRNKEGKGYGRIAVRDEKAVIIFMIYSDGPIT